jgi:hypothetical protein
VSCLFIHCCCRVGATDPTMSAPSVHQKCWQDGTAHIRSLLLLLLLRPHTSCLPNPSVHPYKQVDPGATLTGEVHVENMRNESVTFILTRRRAGAGTDAACHRAAQCLQFAALNGRLKPRETRTIRFTLSASEPGRHHYQVGLLCSHITFSFISSIVFHSLPLAFFFFVLSLPFSLF